MPNARQGIQQITNTSVSDMMTWLERAGGHPYILLTLLLSIAYTIWGIAGRKRRLSAACRNAWAGGMLYRDSVSLTPLIQVFQGRPLALWPLNLVLYARWAGCWIGSFVRCPNHLILCCWIWWWMLFVPTISLILVLGIMSLLVLLTAFLKHLISQVVFCAQEAWSWSRFGTGMWVLVHRWSSWFCSLSPLGYQNVLVVGQAGSWHCWPSVSCFQFPCWSLSPLL